MNCLSKVHPWNLLRSNSKSWQSDKWVVSIIQGRDLVTVCYTGETTQLSGLHSSPRENIYYPVLICDAREESCNLSLDFMLTIQRWINNTQHQSWMKKIGQLKHKN